MKITPTPTTAALAGAFSAIAWPVLRAHFGGAAAGTAEMIIVTLLVVALPAHACVLGFGSHPVAAGRALDAALLKRIGAWLGSAIAVALLFAALRA